MALDYRNQHNAEWKDTDQGRDHPVPLVFEPGKRYRARNGKTIFEIIRIEPAGLFRVIAKQLIMRHGAIHFMKCEFTFTMKGRFKSVGEATLDLVEEV
jgi:hypothetical protein